MARKAIWNGQDWDYVDVPDEEMREQLAHNLRAQRNALLVESDWTQIADVPVDKAAWAAYRDALRTLPDQPGFPYTVDWPVAPQAGTAN